MLRSLGIIAAALAGAGIAGLFIVALAPGAGGKRSDTSVTLQVAPRGLGSVSASPPGLDSDNQPVSECARNTAQHACEWTYPRGTTVTLAAKPDSATGRSFAGWSTSDCPGTGTCKVVLDDDLTSVVGLFTPLRLAVRLSNSDAATASTDPAGVPCRGELHDPTPDLCREFPARTRVTLRVTPSSPHVFKGWSPGCEPVGPMSCAITVLDEATWVGARFDDDDLPGLPTTISVQFRLRKRGTGGGRVTGSKLDCGSQCAAKYDYGTSLALTAVPDSGSVFDGWNGVCAATQMRCTVPVGPVTAIAPVFTHATGPPRAPGSLTTAKRTRTTITLSWSAATGEARVTGYRVYLNGATAGETPDTTYAIRGLVCGRSYTIAVDAVDAQGRRSDKTTSAAQTAPCALTAQLVSVGVARSGGVRTIVLKLHVGPAVSARVSLLAHSRVAVRKSYRIRQGTSALRLRVPKRLAGGRYGLRVTVVARNGATLTLRRNVNIPPARR